MNLLQPILPFLLALGALVTFHELGHYWVARWCGVKVLRFSVGMGKVIYSRRIGPDQTEWALSILPLGGYVKMLDIRENPDVTLSPAELRREFTHQSVWKRMAIVAAGPIANFLLAIAIFSGLYVVGVPEPAARLRAPQTSSVAYAAGLRGGETVTAINGETVQIWSDLRWKLVRLVIEAKPARLDIERPDPAVPGGKLLSTVSLPLQGIGTDDLDGDFVGKLGLELFRPKAVLGKVEPDGAGQRAGLRYGDRVDAIDGVAVPDALAFIERVRASAGHTLQLTVQRGDQSLQIPVTPTAASRDGKSEGKIRVELALGVEMVTARSTPLDPLC